MDRRSAGTTLALAYTAVTLAACVHDQTVQLHYAPDPRIEPRRSAAVTVLRFADRRGDEGHARVVAAPRRGGLGRSRSREKPGVACYALSR